MGPILNTILGAGIKLAANLINAWLEQKRQDQMFLAARDEAMMKAMFENQMQQAKDPFVQVTRRILFIRKKLSLESNLNLRLSSI